MIEVPRYDELMYPTLKAIKKLGGSATVDEILETVILLEQVPTKVQDVPHRGGRTKLAYNLAWARTNLKEIGLLTNSSRGVWAATEHGEKISEAEMQRLLKQFRQKLNKKHAEKRRQTKSTKTSEEDHVDESTAWQDEVLGIICSISPSQFEHLSKRILREAGFIKVEVTGKSGDGGIDGIGILKVELMSFYIYFQCKKYKTNKPVGPKDIRDFRGALQGRGEKGLFITTTSFSSGAKAEASRDGAPPIDLVDGEQLCILLREYGLGIQIEQTESVHVDQDWFKAIGV